MGIRQIGGNGGEYAEIILDYKNKKIDILNPTTRKELSKKWYTPQLKYFSIGFILCFLTLELSRWFGLRFLSSLIKNYTYYSYGLAVILAWGLLLIPKVNDWYSYLTQKLLNDYLDKRVVVVESLKEKEYKLPFVFRNNILEYECYGDYKKLEKVHIKPLNYYYKRDKGLVKQTKEWEAFFTFEEIPRQGKMIVSFV